VANLIVSAVSTFDNKGLKKGKKEVSAFEKQIKSFGKVFAGVFSATALLNYSKKAVQAFAADEKAAKALELQLRNVGFAFSAPSVETYIANLQKTTGVLDDQLRPAFQQLLTVTGSITKSQDALNTALNVSAATGKSLTEVSAALTRGYSGNTAGLSRLGAGISKATLKAGDMDKILAELNKKFAGQAQARLTTYSGKMDLLKVASENVKEEIGKGIIGALDALSDDNSIGNATTQMEDFGKSIGKSITGIGILIGELKKIPGSRKTTDILFGTNIFSMSAKLTELFAKDKFPSGPDKGGSERTASRIFVDQIRRENKIIRDTNKARADELAKLKAKSEIDKLAEKFDVERIGLMKALNETTDAETKLRIQAKLAILDNNEALAKKINAELEAAKKVAELGNAFTNASAVLAAQTSKLQSAFDSALNALLARIATAGFMTPASVIAGLSLVDQLRIEKAEDAFTALNLTNPEFIASMASERQAVSAISGGGNQFSLSFDTTFTGDRFTQLIAESLQLSEKTGYSTSPAGSINP